MVKKISVLVFLIVYSIAFSQNNLRKKLGSYIDSLTVHHKVMGSFAIATQDKVDFVKVTGFADVENKQKANMNTQYRIGSISKTFTAVLIMKAIEEKKLSINTKLSVFYPEIENADKISIEQLLQHRSGVHSLTDENEYWSYNTLPQTEKSLLDIIKKYKSDFSPGSKFAYSNSNYILLGFILEKIYKKPYAEIVQERIAKPLNLMLTRVGDKIDVSKNQANSYQYANSNYTKWQETDMSIPIGAGNIISTPTELLQFIIALENGKLIKKSSLKQMQKFVDDYGYGITKVPFNKYWGYGHNGGIDQFSSALYYFPDLKSGISFITNQSDYDNNQLSINMMSTVINKDFKIANFKKVEIDATILKKYEGIYKTNDFPLDLKIFIENGELKGQATGQSAFILDAVSETEFKFDRANIKMQFDSDKKTMNFTQGANNFVFQKQ